MKLTNLGSRHARLVMSNTIAASGHLVCGYSKNLEAKKISFSKESLYCFVLNLKKDTSCIQFLPNKSIQP